MAILNVKEEWKSLALRTSVDDAQFLQSFTVLFDNKDPIEKRPLLAVQHTAIPRRYQRHPYNPWLWVTGHRTESLGPCFYRVYVDYAVRPHHLGRQEQVDPLSDNPFDQPMQVEWNTVVSSEKIDRDILGNPIVNSAGESSDPPLFEDFYEKVCRITRNEQVYDPFRAHQYEGAVNSDYFSLPPGAIFKPGQVRCIRYSGRLLIRADLCYWEVFYEFHCRFDGFIRRILDEGFREFEGYDEETGEPKFKAITAIDGTALSQPVQLNGSGVKLKKGEVPVSLYYKTKRQLPFSALGI